MAKDPAFLFYPGDFNTGTQFFTDEQVGKYMRLLMAQHQHGHLTENQVLMICKTYDKDVMNKFVKDSNGLWYNERLEIEVVKRKEYSLSRSKNRSSKNDISKTYVPHMENKNENKDLILKEGQDFIVVGADVVYDVNPILEFYEAQLNGMMREMGNIAWKPLVKVWFNQHISEEFKDGLHVKNSFKKFYFGQKKVVPSEVKPVYTKPRAFGQGQ